MITVSINGVTETLPKNCTVLKALETLGYDHTGMLGVAINQVFISKDRWADKLLQNQDKVDILNPVSGG